MSREVTPVPVKSKKKKKFGLFRRKKSKDKLGDASPDASLDDNDSEIYEFSDLEDGSDDGGSEEVRSDSIVAPGLHYTDPGRSKSSLVENSRGRELARGKNENSDRPRSRSRSRSVSRAFRNLIGGSKTKSSLDIGSAPKEQNEECSANQHDQRKIHPLPGEETASLEDPDEEKNEARRSKSKTKKHKDENSHEDSLTGIEISLHDDATAEIAPSSSKKKKKSKRKKEKDSVEDDETASRDSLPPLSKKKSSRKKTSADGSSTGESYHQKKIKKKKSKRDFDVVNRAMRIKQQRANTQEDLKDTLKHREERKESMQEVKDRSSFSQKHNWENEEYLISPKPKSGRSMISEQSSQKGSVRAVPAGIDESLPFENENAVADLVENVSSLSKEVESQRKENSKLQKSLADAVLKISKLNDDLREQELGHSNAKSELQDIKEELESVKEQNDKLHKSLDDVEMELSTKNDHLNAFEQMVEEHLERVEFLEKKLEETEDELFKMEVELKKTEREKAADDTPGEDRTEKVNSIRVGRMERMASKKNLNRGDSVRDIINGSLDKSVHNRRASDLASRERKLEERERQLQVGRDRDQTREQRLKEWEEELLAKEKTTRAGYDPVLSDMLKSRERDLVERERLLQQREAEVEEGRRSLKNHVALPTTDDEKDSLIKDLKAECQELLSEKEELIRKHKEEDLQREEDLQAIQEDIDERLTKLDDENEELRQLLEEAEEGAKKSNEFKSTISKLEAEIVILKKAASADGDQADVIRELHEEVSQQLTELDKENRKLSNRLVKEQKSFQKKIDEKEGTILELEETIEELEKKRDIDAKASAERPSTEELSKELEEALEHLKDKQTQIDTLQKKLGVITEEFEQRNAQDLLSKNATIQQLKDELTATRAVIEAKTSDQLSTEMKAEIKSLKDVVRDLNKRIRQEQNNARSKIKKLDSSLFAAERETMRLKQELERNDKREEKRAALKEGSQDEDMKQHLEDLEDEVDHWKKVSMELEDELAHWKSEANELKMKMEEEEDNDLDDNASVGSYTSEVSRQSFRAKRRSSLSHTEPLNKSHHSFSSLSREDMFFVNSQGPSDSASEPVEASSSQRAMRTVTDLWSKMTMKQPSAPTGLYQMSLDD